jgi:hypothetical protein
VVSNSGKSVAKDCQIYIEFAQEKIKQVAWALPNNNVFEKHIGARVSKEAGNYEQLVESYIHASSAATFLELIKKKD